MSDASAEKKPPVCESTFVNDYSWLRNVMEGLLCQGVTTESPLATIADDSQHLALKVVKF